MPDVMNVQVVSARRQMNAFLRLPYRMYRDDALWAPPIRPLDDMEIRRGTNPVLARSNHRLLLATDGSGRTRGRIIVYEDPRFNDYHRSRTGFFGSFEADCGAAADALFAEAERWCGRQGLEGILGPIDPVAECWGFTIKGFHRPPVFLSPYNPPEYPVWTEAAGFIKAKDLLVYEMDSRNDYALPDRYRVFEEHFAAKHPRITTRPLNMRDFRAEVKRLVDVTNAGVEGNWGFVPIGDDERDALAAKLRFIVDPAAVWFVEDGGRPVACCMGFPDLNIPIRRSRGRLLPLGLFRMLRAKNTLADYRLWSLAVLPEYHGIGLDALLYLRLYRSLALRPRGIRLEANYVLEDNPRIVLALEKLGLTLMKTYRVYEKTLS